MSSTAQKVSVKLPDCAYDITVQPGLLSQIGEHLRAITQSARAAIVTDTNVGPHHAATAEISLRASGFDVVRATVPADEENKTLATISSIYDALLNARVERSTPILALGGGVIGDMTGFAAATVLRGVPFVQVPTTLLAMVDASVGGKTGVNHAAGKNLIGSFHQPIAVFIDPQTLRTLPPPTLSEGLAECIKHDIIRDAAGFERIERDIRKARALDMAYLTDLVAHNVAIKARVVEADPFEHGERAHLNYGHTFAHAIEKVSHFGVSHGAAVGLGMCAAAYVSVQLNLIDDNARTRITKVIDAAGLPTRGLAGLGTDALVAAMAHDKKVQAGKIRLVLPDRIGHAIIRDDVSADIIRNAVESVRG